jgi:hypothetical protein
MHPASGGSSPTSRYFESVIGRDLRELRTRAIMLGLVASQAPASHQLDATAEETMSPIARRPMLSSLLAAA